MDFQSNFQRKCTAFPYAIGQEIRTLRQSVLKSNLIDLNELCDAEFNHYLNWKRQTDAFPYSSAPQQQQQQKPSDERANLVENCSINCYKLIKVFSMGAIICLMIGLMLINFNVAVDYFTSIRCFVPNNYMIWEATRPISNCEFCAGVNRPLILSNVSQTEFLVSPSEQSCAI